VGDMKNREIHPRNRLRINQIQTASLLPFLDEREAYYFGVYQNEAAVELAGSFQSSPWTRTMLQTAHTEPFILRSLVAIGALNKSLKLSYLASNCAFPLRETNQELSVRHREAALAAYDKAIVGMRNICIRNDAQTIIRKSLIASILISTIEMFLESPIVAHTQSEVGYAILRQLEAGKAASKSGIGTPDPSLVEDEIYHEFSRLDLLGAQRWSDHSPAKHGLRRQDGNETIKNMPTVFGSLGEAQVYQVLLSRRAWHLIGETYGSIIDIKEDERHPIYGDSPGELVDPCYIPTNLIASKEACINDLHRWTAAFKPILPRLLASKDLQTCISAAQAESKILHAEIELVAAYTVMECDLDHYLPTFREMVSLSELAAKKTNSLHAKGVPIFDTEFLYFTPLEAVAMYCRDRDLRFRALDILKEMATRDTTKQVQRAWTRVSYVVALEEASSKEHGGGLPEEARWRRVWVLHHYGDAERHMTVVCVRRTGYPLGKRYPARREFRWRLFLAGEMEEKRTIVEPGPEREWNLGRTEWYEMRIEKPPALVWGDVWEEMLRIRPRIE
jgi:hypothetical protein